MKRAEFFGLPRCSRVTAAVIALTVSFTVAVGASSARSGAGSTPLTLVGIGDSTGDAANCQPCTSYVELYGHAAMRALHRSVETINLSQSTNLDSAGLLSLVRSDEVFRTNLASADLITVTIGNNDLAPCDFTPETDHACEVAIRQLGVNLKATLLVIKKLRHGRRTALRVTDYFNAAIGDPAAPPGEAFQQDFAEKLGEQNAAICSAASATGAVCVDLVRPFNGRSGSKPANQFLMSDHTHPNAEGQRKIAEAIAAVGFAPLGFDLAGAPAGRTALTVCPSGCRYTQLAPALADAKSGDTIKIGAGTYRGGVTVKESVKLVGAGASSTIIKGGGSVLTIGTYGASNEPTVSIDGVTITGGIARSSPESIPFVGEDGVIALGGGIEIPPNAGFTGGARVSISASAISGNRVAPTHSLPLGPPCPNGPCPFALAAGGGIDNWGTLTLSNTVVSDNRVGSASGLSDVASDANAGAIMNSLGPLKITNSVVSGNATSATAPNGRFADSGGIFVEGGTLSLRNSTVRNNSAVLAAALPSSVGLLAVAGGIHLSSSVPAATITNATISDNTVSMTNNVGDSSAFSAGVHVDLGVDFKMSNSVAADNRVSSKTLQGSSGSAGGDSGVGELHGEITNTRFTGNSVSVSSRAGDATAGGGAAIFFGTITNGVVSQNRVQASSPRGSVALTGGALVADEGGFTLRNTVVSRNRGDASGLAGAAQGGGIFDAAVPNGPPGGPLTLINSSVFGNELSGGNGITLQGGGLFTSFPPVLMNTLIAENEPDQCYGC